MLCMLLIQGRFEEWFQTDMEKHEDGNANRYPRQKFAESEAFPPVHEVSSSIVMSISFFVFLRQEDMKLQTFP